MKQNNFLFSGYNKKGDLIDSFVIEDRTENEANNEAMQYVEAHQNIDDWSLSPATPESPEPVQPEGVKDNQEGFTKGQWIAMNKTGTGIYKIVSDTLQEICETQMPYGDNLSRPEVFEQGKANALLISEAPVMRKYINYVREKVSGGSVPYSYEDWKEVGKPDYE